MHEQLKFKNYGGDGGLALGNYWQIGYILWNTGKKEKAQKLFNDQISASKKALKLGRWPGNFNYDLAAIYAFLGDTKQAMGYLRAYEKEGFNNGLEYFILVDSFFESLRNNQEFKEIVETAQAKKAEIRTRIKELERKGEL